MKNINVMYSISYILTPVEFGGSERVNITFLEQIDRTKFKVLPILLIRPWEKKTIFVERLCSLGFNYWEIPVAKRPRVQGTDYLRVFRSFYMLINILKQNSIDIVHTHGYFADIIGITAAKIIGIPSVSTCHGFISNNKKLNFYNAIDKFLLNFCDKIIAVSYTLANELASNGIKKKKINVIPNAVKTNISKEEYEFNRYQKRKLLKISENNCVIGFVGRLSDEKGIDIALKTSISLISKNKNYYLIIVGDGPLKNNMEKISLQNKLEDNVIFIGFQKNVEKWLSMMDIFIMPSLSEGTPMALLEAMAVGVPIIASSVGGIPHIIKSGINGLLIPKGSSDDLLKAIQELQSNDNMRRKLSEAAKRTVLENYNVHDWVEKIQSLYRQTMEEKVRGCQRV